MIVHERIVSPPALSVHLSHKPAKPETAWSFIAIR